MRRSATSAAAGYLRRSSGLALVQVLVMALLVALVAAGFMKTMMMDYTLIFHTTSAAQSRYWMEACLAQKTPIWQSNPACGGNACCGGGSDSCTFVSGGRSIAVSITCSGPAPQKVQFATQY